MIDLKEKRREARMTQVELAKAVGVVPQHISNIELGLFNPSVKTAMKIARILNFDWVLFFDDKKKCS